MSRELLQQALDAPGDDVGLLEYRGNSVSFIYDKMRAYRDAIDAAWKALSAAHMPPDGKTSVAEAITKLAAAPVVPLTDEQIRNMWDGHTVAAFGRIGINPIVFARAIERAHGIGGGGNG